MSTGFAAASRKQEAGVEKRGGGCGCHDGPEEVTGVPRFLTNLIQPKLVVGAPDDGFEREADAAARAAVREEPVEAALPAGGPRVQRMCTECMEEEMARETGAPPGGTSFVQRLAGDPGGTLSGGVDGGSGLESGVRSRLEGSFGTELADVRVHRGPTAGWLTRSLGARAFTHGSHIWVGDQEQSEDVGLMAHEVTHVLQQTSGQAGPPRIQRAPADYRHPEDGGGVATRMQEAMSEADETDSEEPPTPHEARSAAGQVDRGELSGERSRLEPEARPEVDRPAAEAPKVQQAEAETKREADTPGEPIAEGEGKEGAAETGEGKGEGGAGGAAAAAASIAEAAAVPPGPEVEVVPPEPVEPVDAGGQPLPADAAADLHLTSLAGRVQALRSEGTRVRGFAAEEQNNAGALAANLGIVATGLSQAETGVSRSKEHLAFRQELATQARGALAVSEEKAATVAAEAPEYSAKADEGKAESGPMADEAEATASENAANTPSDPEAAARAREQGGKMNQAASEIGTTDDAISQTQTKAAELAVDAARAKETNTATKGKVDETDATLAATGDKLGEMGAQNAQAKAGMQALSSAPQQQRQQALEVDRRGEGLIRSSFDMESRLHDVQAEYESAMSSVPAAEEPEPVEPEAAAESAAAAPASTSVGAEPEIGADILVQRQIDVSAPAPDLAAVNEDAGAVAAVAEPQPAGTEDEAGGGAEGETEAGPAGTNAAGGEEEDQAPAEAESADVGGNTAGGAEGAALPPPPAPPEMPQRETVDAAGAVTEALPSWMTGVEAPNERQRQEATAAAEQRRADQILEIESEQSGGFQDLSATDKMGLALRMTGRNLFGSVGAIQWPGFGALAVGLIDPRGPLMGVVSGLSMMLSGAANLFSAEQWKRDPLGNLLKSAADIATGLTVILGSITALAGVVIAIMTAITILSFGTAAPITGPVIAFCTTVLTTVGGWTIAVGQVALVLQALVLIKNLIDAACAETAAELQSEADQMTENVSDAGNVLMQMGMAKAGQLGARTATSQIQAAGGGVRYAAQMGARAGVGVRAGASAAARGVRALPGAAVRGARALPGAAARGARALPSAAVRGAGAVGRGLVAGGRALGRGMLTGGRAVGRGVVAGGRALGRGARSAAVTVGRAARGAPGAIARGARALPRAAVRGGRSIPGLVGRGARSVWGGIRGLPGRMRASWGEGLSRKFLLGDDIADLGAARGASAEARAGVLAEARAPGGLLAGEGRAAGAADEVLEAPGAGRAADETIPASPDEAVARIEDTPPSSPAQREASVRESGAMDSADLTPQQAADEVAHVRDHPELMEGNAPNRRARVGDHEIVERPAPDTPAGVSCARHSNGGLPVPCPTPPATGGATLPQLNRLQRARLKRLGDRLHERGLGWNDLGLVDEQAVARHFAGHATPEQAIAALEARMNRVADIRGVHAGAQRTGGTHADEGSLELASPQGRGIRVESPAEVPPGQRLPRPTDTPDANYGGAWGGERGNSEWFSDVQAVNDITGYRPVQFVGGEPVFLPWARERAIIRMTGVDHVDFAAADRALLRQHPGRWANQTAVAEWRSSQRLTWHHEPDVEMMTLVPTDLHGNVPHVGGASAARSGAVPERVPPFETSPL